MEEKREPLSEMAIERKIQILRNKHMDSEVIALVKSDYEYGLTDDEIGLYLNKSYDIEQMKVLSKCLHKGVSEELLTLLKDSRMAAPKMQTALDYYEKGVPIDAIREVVQKDDTAVNMRRMFDVVLDKLNKAKEQMPQDLEYVKSLVAQMDEVVAKINHQNERYDALNKKLSEIETSKDDEEVRERLVKENQDKDALINSQQNELNKAIQSINESLDATILMVTHDAFSASYANRILFLRDGAIFAEILKGSDSRRVFFEKILDVLTMMGGGVNDVR